MKREEKILGKGQEHGAENRVQWAVKQIAIDEKQFQQFFNKYNSFSSQLGGWEASVLAIRAAGAVFNN